MNKIVIDAGHGGSNIGASANGFIEKHETLKIALRLKDKFDCNDYDVKMIRTTDEFVANSKRAQIANQFGADLYVSLHYNGASNPEAYGTETLYYAGSNQGEKAAATVHEELLNKLMLKDRGLKGRTDLVVLRNTSMPAILIEPLFLSNACDARILRVERGLDNITSAIKTGIDRYFSE